MSLPVASLFQLDDVLTFRLSDGSHRAAICAQISAINRNAPLTPKSGTRRTYDLVLTSFHGETTPTVPEIRRCSIVGTVIETSLDPAAILELQPGVDALWPIARGEGEARPFIFGSSYWLMPHKDAVRFADRFTRIGTLRLRHAFKRQGAYGYISSFEAIEQIALRFPIGVLFPLALLCE